MDELVGFWCARLDEAEAAATRAAKYNPAPWVVDELGDLRDANGKEIFAPGGYEGVCFYESAAEFIARHDPARVLRQVEAGRKLLALYENQPGYDLPEGVHDGRDPDERACDAALRVVLGDIVSDRATVYSDHPDYREEWKP